MNKCIWISWESHRRTREICQHLNIELIEISPTSSGSIRYLFLSLKTLKHLIKTQPKVLIVQNPSIVLALIGVVLKPLFRYTLIVDAHNEAIEPYNHPTKIIKNLAKFIIRHSNLTVITNRFLQPKVAEAQGHTLILPDKVPFVPTSDCPPTFIDQAFTNIVLIATFAKDEPITNVISAAEELGDSVRLYITGNPKIFIAKTNKFIPENISFTGFLPDDDYWKLLKNADAIIDLTTKDNCLVCGAYEGVAVETPLILSDNPATRDLFNKGCLYTDEKPKNIVKAIQGLLGNKNIRQEIIALKKEMNGAWVKHAKQLFDYINEHN